MAGPGTLQNIRKSQAQVKAYMKRSPYEVADSDPYVSELEALLAMGADEPGKAPQEEMKG